MSFGPLIAPDALQTMHPLRILDARTGPDLFAKGHLEGALHADLNRDLSAAMELGFDPSRGGRHPLPDPHRWATQLGEWGIDPDTRVVAYDDASGGSGACRLWWMLRASGHRSIAVLDGGLQAALASGLPMVTSGSPVTPKPPYPFEGWKMPVVDILGVENRLPSPDWKVLDVRSRERWRGESEPLDPVAGRIPGTLNLPFTENLDSRGLFKSPDALRRMYLALLESTPPERLIVHCGSGVTACHTLLALDLAGLHGAALYTGSYSEWCRSGRPIGKG